MKKILSAVFFTAVFLIILPIRVYTASEDVYDEIKMYMGEIEILPASNPSRIVIGNPKVADVADVTRKEITLTPVAPGTTTFVLWDNYGEKSYRVKVYAENIEENKRRVDNLLAKINLPEVYTQAEEDEGKILIMGRVKSPQDREKISTVLGALREKIVDLVVVREEESVIEIAVQVLEVDKDSTATLGFTFPSSLNVLEVGSPGLQAAGVKWDALFRVIGFERATSGGTADPWSWRLDALIQEGKARVLSRPRLACQSGKEAELLVGGEKPIFTTDVASAGGEGTSVEYKEYGIKLKIKPTLNEGDRIKLALNVEVSEVGTAETIGSATTTTAKAYPVTKRNASTELFMQDGQTMVIGGLIKRKSTEDIRKVPFLGDLPLIGFGFRKKVSTTGGGAGEKGNTELFITLTPKIVSGGSKEALAKDKTLGPSVTQAGGADASDPVGAYSRLVQQRILENVNYPPMAKEAGFQGTVKLTMSISDRGELLEAKVKESSGYKILDDSALNTAKAIPAYPPFPSSIELKELWVDVPIVYQMDSD